MLQIALENKLGLKGFFRCPLEKDLSYLGEPSQPRPAFRESGGIAGESLGLASMPSLYKIHIIQKGSL